MPSLPPPAVELRPFQYRRMAAVVLVVLAGFIWILVRLIDIQIIRHRELVGKAREYSRITRVREPWRGEIRDRNGKTMAISVPVKAVYLDLTLWSSRPEQIAETVGRLMRIPAQQLSSRVQACLCPVGAGGLAPQKALLIRRDVPLREWRAIATALELETFGLGKPQLNVAEQAALRKLRRRLLFARDEQYRRYPWGESLCQILGFVSTRTNSAGLVGCSGIERGCDQILAGTRGLCVSEQDAAGNELPARRTRCEVPVAGNHVVLTIDLRLQQIVEQALRAARTQYRARGASAVVMDPGTGEILALACCPGFDPHNPGASAPETWRNSVFTDMVEPGSILKFIPLAGVLDGGLMTLDSGVHCEQGRFVVNQVTVRDHASYGLLTLRQAFARSSNIALVKIALALGAQRFHHCLTNFGLARSTGIPFATETPGRISPPQTWSTMALSRAAFGQGVSVSQLQMAVAMCAIANGGRLMRPWVVRRIESPQGRVLRQFQPQIVRSVISPQAAQQVTEALKEVAAPGGTGAGAALEHFTLALKTGTAQKSDSKGYLAGRYYSSMVGFFPADAPRVVISVALDEPQNGYYAGTVVAPAFRAIAEQIAVCLEIPPDKAARSLADRSLARSKTASTPADRLAAARKSGTGLHASRASVRSAKP